MRLVLEQSQRNPDIALHIHERGPVHVQLCIAKVLRTCAVNKVLFAANTLFIRHNCILVF